MARVSEVGDRCVVALSNSHLTAIVDQCEKEAVGAFSWHLTRNGYVARCRRTVGGGNQAVLLHRQVSGAAAGQIVDHINGDKLDNRRCNLRIVDKSQNRQNFHESPSNRTGVRNVYFHPNGKEKPYYARLTVRGKFVHLGYFATIEEAAAAARIGRQLFHSHSPENRVESPAAH